MRKRQALTSFCLSVLFLIVYGGTSWITAHRSDVGTLYFAWERYIPFVPLLIIPYMSIDLFFVVAPFLCTSDEERNLFARRITAAILAAGACFLLMPLRFAFPRPFVGGWLGPIFTFLHGFDQPYNLLPSLHIALRTLLAEIYGRHSRGYWRMLSHIWFSLIGFSTVLTYQHHVLDLVGGFVLAALCFYFIQPKVPRLEVVPNVRVGSYYLAGAAILAIAAVVFWPWGLILFWPALSLGLTASAYWGLGPSVYRKSGGRLPLAAQIVLAPLFAGQYLSLKYYQRHCHPWDEVAPGVFLGRRLTQREAEGLKGKVKAVLDLTAEFSATNGFVNDNYLNIPILDLTAPTLQHLQRAVGFIEAHSKSGIVYVHCKIGYSRSAAVVAAYLLKTGLAKTAEEAIQMIRTARPPVIIRPEARRAILLFEESLRKSPQDQPSISH